jgi:hypothetical protein
LTEATGRSAATKPLTVNTDAVEIPTAERLGGAKAKAGLFAHVP